MPYLTIGNCVITIEDCPIAIGDPCAPVVETPCFVDLLTQGGSLIGSTGDLTLTYDLPDNSGTDVTLYLYFYAKVAAAIVVDNGFTYSTDIDNGVDGKLYLYTKTSADNLTGETVSISTTLSDGRITAMLICHNMFFGEHDTSFSASNVTTISATLPSGTSDPVVVDAGFTVLAQPFGHSFGGGTYWTVDDPNAIVLGNQEAGGASGVALSAYVWDDSETDGIPGTITWNTDAGVSRPEVHYVYLTCSAVE